LVTYKKRELKPVKGGRSEERREMQVNGIRAKLYYSNLEHLA